MDILPNGDIVTSSEDRTVRVFRDMKCIQTITHPAVSIWSVAASTSGDIVTGASDKIIRVFTRDEDRLAAPEALKDRLRVARLAELYDDETAGAVRVLYGGSVKSGNVAQIMAQPDVDGALVGGASLDPEEFARIVRYQAHVAGRGPGMDASRGGNPLVTQGFVL